MYTEELRTKARKVAGELVWKLETLQHRMRYNYRVDPPTIKTLPTRIKRFSNALPQDLVTLVIDELVAMAPYSGIVFNGDDEGDEILYRPTNTYVKRDQTLGDPGRHRADHTYTIVQDLVLVDGEADMFGSVESSSCSRTVNVERYWDEPDLPDCQSGRQGVSYQVTDVSRDHDTDLFSYSVREVVALTQHVPEHVVECNEEFERTVESWDNVYGQVGSFRYDADNEERPGAEIELPKACGAGTGHLVQVSISENDDCTFKIQVTRTTSKLRTAAEFSIYRDQFAVKSSVTDKGAANKLDREGVEYHGGVKTTYDSRQNPDGTYDNRIATEVERPVSSAVVETRKTLRGIVKSVTNRNQKTAYSDAKLVIGASVRNEKTEGGLYNQTIVTPSVESVGRIRSGCTKTVFMHDHSTVENVATEPTVLDVQSAAGGVVLSRQVNATDEGTFDVSEEVRTELPVKSAVIEERRTLRALVKTVTHRNQGSVASLPAGIGSSVRSELTDGGLYNQTITTTEARLAGLLRTGCQRTLFWHEHSTTENKSTDPGSDTAPAGGGVTHQRQVTATDDGTFDVTDSTRTEHSVTEAVMESRVTLRGIVHTVMHRSQPGPAASPTSLGSSVRNEKTDGGLYNQTVTTVAARQAGNIANACSKTAFEHQDSSTSNVGSAPGPEVLPASQGVTNQRQVRATDEGTFDVTDTTTTEIQQSGAVVEKQRTTHGLVTTTTNKAMRTVSDPRLNIGESFTKTLTPGACHDTVHREVTVDASDYRTWDAEVSLNHLYSKTIWFENATESQYKQLITNLQNLADNKEKNWVAQHRPPSSIRVSPEVRHTEVDRFDGQVNFTATWSPQSAGQTGATEDIFAENTCSGQEDDNKGGYTRTYNTYTACGRGLKRLERLMDASVTGGTIDVSFSFQHDETWTLQRKIQGAWTKRTIGAN